MPGLRSSCASATGCTARDQVISDDLVEPACPSRSAAAASSMTSRSATARASGRGAHTLPFTLSMHQFRRAAAVGAGNDRLAATQTPRP